MDTRRPGYSLVEAVAVTFLVIAVLGVIDMVMAIVGGAAKLNFSVLGFFIAPGLRRLHDGWRTVALVYAMMTAIILITVRILFLTTESGFFFEPLVSLFQILPIAFVFGLDAALIALHGWQMYALSRPHVTHLFRGHLQAVPEPTAP